MRFAVHALFCSFLLFVSRAESDTYNLDDSGGLGRRFDGIGGLSGGGVGTCVYTSWTHFGNYCIHVTSIVEKSMLHFARKFTFIHCNYVDSIHSRRISLSLSLSLSLIAAMINSDKMHTIGTHTREEYVVYGDNVTSAYLQICLWVKVQNLTRSFMHLLLTIGFC